MLKLTFSAEVKAEGAAATEDTVMKWIIFREVQILRLLRSLGFVGDSITDGCSR